MLFLELRADEAYEDPGTTTGLAAGAMLLPADAAGPAVYCACGSAAAPVVGGKNDEDDEGSFG